MSQLKCFLQIALYLSVFGLGCKLASAPEPESIPSKNISYAQHIRPLFLDHCAIEVGCHASSQPAGELDLQTPHPDFISQSGLVVLPTDPEHSLLYQLLLDRVGTIPRMPLRKNPLSWEHIQAIRTWIQEGAHVNN